MNFTGSEANLKQIRHRVSFITTLISLRTCAINMCLVSKGTSYYSTNAFTFVFPAAILKII